VDAERLPDYVAERKEAYADEARRRAEIDHDMEAAGMGSPAPGRLRVGENMDLDALVARLRALSSTERAGHVQAILDMPGVELDEDGNFEPEPHYLRYTYQYLTEAGLIDRPARPYQVVGYQYECEWSPRVWPGELPDGTVYRCYEQVAGPFATKDEAQAAAEQFRARERAENPVPWRRKFRVRHIRDRYERRESLQLGPDEVADLLPPEQRTPPES
jgi:hypothetical protein